MREKIEEMDKKLDKVLNSLQGDKIGNPGIWPMLTSHAQKILKLENFKLELTTKAGLLITLISTILSTVISFLASYFSN